MCAPREVSGETSARGLARSYTGVLSLAAWLQGDGNTSCRKRGLSLFLDVSLPRVARKHY